METIQVEIDGVVGILTITREKALNAINRQVFTDVLAGLKELEADAAVRGVIITGAGEKAFVAGADIAEMSAFDAKGALSFVEGGHAIGDYIASMTKPVIAAVNGFALGGGCELALACDFMYASQKAKFGQPEVNLGVIPGFGGTTRLPRRIGSQRAMEAILTGDIVGAEEALRLGLVNRVCEPGELMNQAKATVQKIAQKGPLAIAAAKRAVRASEELPLSRHNALERELFAKLFESTDQKEGMKAFVEKRAPQFTGK
jgi:enoyl-CoA hydratase